MTGVIINSSQIHVENRAPNVPTIIFPTQDLNTSLNHLNASNFIDLDGDTVTLYWYINGTFNKTSTGNTTFSASPGTYAINLSAYDETDWSANSTTVEFTFDNINTLITEVDPTLANNSITNVSYNFINFTITEDHLQYVKINLTGPIFSETNGRNTTLWDKDLVLSLHFEEGNGSTTANDSSGNNLDGTLTSIAAVSNETSGWNTSSIRGTGLNFDGDNDLVSVADNSKLNITDEITITAWVRDPPTINKRTERDDLSNWNSRTTQLANGQLQTTFRGGWVSYLADDDTWKPIDYEFEKTENGWISKDAPFIAIAPLRSDGIAYFVSNNRWDVFDKTTIDSPNITQTIEALDVVSVEGVKETGDLGLGAETYIIYKNAYPHLNADLIYFIRQGIAPRMDKLVRFNSAPENDLRLDFRITYVTENNTEIKSAEGMWNKTDILKTNNAISIKPEGEESRRGIGLKAVKIWDVNTEKIQNIDIELRSVGEEQYILTKIIPVAFFKDAVLPVYTDTESTYYPDAHIESNTVDGDVLVSGTMTWATAHDDTVGDVVQDSQNYSRIAIIASATTDRYGTLHRGVSLFDTSSIPDDAVIDSATFEAVIVRLKETFPEDLSISIVSSSPATDTALVLEDYDQVGSVGADAATKQGPDIFILNLTADSITYNAWTLNATGIANISKTAITRFGQRVDVDANGTGPVWAAGEPEARIDIASADETVPGDIRPKLVVTYHIPVNKTIVSKGLDAYALELNNSGDELQGNINSNEVIATVSTPLAWHHHAMTYNGSNLTLYIDGVYANSTAVSGAINTNANDLIIGDNFTGTLDEIKIWKRALTATEISADYNLTSSNYLTTHSVSGNVHTFSLNMTNLTDGDYTWTIWANDTASNENRTNARYLNVDTLPPNNTINLPASNTNLSGSFLINVSVNDTNDVCC